MHATKFRSTRSPKAAAATLEELTPSTRDRYVDLLRVFSILVVVVGHWLMAAITWNQGRPSWTNAITLTSGLWIATWLLQVMPLFFFVGGFANSVAMASLERRGEGYGAFLGGRVRRLMRPTLVFIGIWMVVAPLVQLMTGNAAVRTALDDMARPLWFLGVYLIVVALAPAMLRLHRRYRVRVPAALAAAAISVDLLRFALDVPHVGYLNFGFVWLFAHQLGFFYADGSLLRVSRRAVALAGAAAVSTLGVLVGSGMYHGSMVGLPGQQVTNTNPPTVCLVVLSVILTSVAMLIRPAGVRFAARPRAWRAVVGLNSVIMTMFLWHITAMLIGAPLWHAAGMPEPQAGSGAWYALRPAWIALLGATLVALVALTGRYEHPRPVEGRHIPAHPAFGVTLLIVGVIGFAVTGFGDMMSSSGRTLIVLPVFPVQNAVLVAGGMWLLHPRRSFRDSVSP